MMYSRTGAQAKRRALRERLAGPGLLRFPGAFNALSAQLIQDKGFEGVYISGAVLAADLGMPDVGLTTLSEVADRSRTITRMVDLPCLVDADTGFGDVLNIARTVQALEDAGVAGLHIEDQVTPKRCGHLDGKAVVGQDAAVRRVRAAVEARRDPDLLVIARTDVRSLDGPTRAIERAKALVDAGADVIFPEAMVNAGEFEAVAGAVDVPVLANLTEFGKTESLTTTQLEDAGVRMVIYPVSLLRLAMGAAEAGLDALVDQGSLASQIGSMQQRSRLYELIEYGSYDAFEDSWINGRGAH